MPDFEYNTIVTTSQLNPGIADATGDEVSQSFAQLAGQMTQTIAKSLDVMPSYNPNNKKLGGWEIVSQSWIRLDRHLVFSFLVKRPL